MPDGMDENGKARRELPPEIAGKPAVINWPGKENGVESQGQGEVYNAMSSHSENRERRPPTKFARNKFNHSQDAVSRRF